MNRLKAFFGLLKETYDEWNRDRAPRLAAALAYYTTFSIAPFLIVVIAITGFVAGQDAMQGRLDEQIQGLVGREGADLIQEFVRNASKPSENILASIIGVVTLLLGAGGVFGQLQDALNTVWGVEVKPGQGILATLKSRFLSFSMVLGVGFLLLVSLVLSSFIAGIHNFFLGLLPGAETILQLVNFLVSFGIVTLLFALIYKLLPDVQIEWRDVWVGAAVTSLLFTIGKTALGIYLGNSGVLSAYGAAGSLVLILLWIFYSAQILLFGAEFTQVYATRYGSKIVPAENAIAVTPEARARQGMSADAEKPVTPEVPPAPIMPLRQAAMRAMQNVRSVSPPPQLPDEPARSTPQAIAPILTIFTTFFAFIFGFIWGAQRDD